MSDGFFSNYLKNCQNLSTAMTGLMHKQWQWLNAHCRFGMNILGSVLGRVSPRDPVPPGKKEANGPAAPDTPENLEKAAAERLSKGLAPPREIYDARYRDRIDWNRIPQWARSVDPELFEGCVHEG
jgi:hypothetical protein